MHWCCHALLWYITLHWRHDDHDGVSNHQPRGCLLNRLFRRRSKKASKLRVTGLCAGNSPGPVNSPHKGPVTRKMFPFDDVIMITVMHYNYDGSMLSCIKRIMCQCHLLHVMFNGMMCWDAVWWMGDACGMMHWDAVWCIGGVICYLNEWMSIWSV